MFKKLLLIKKVWLMNYPNDFVNKIIHNDCMNVFPFIPDRSIDLVLTDIPYNEVSRKSNGLRQLDKGKADLLDFNLELFLEQVVRITKGSIYIFCGIEQVSFIRRSLVDFGLSTRHCIYEKTNPSPMNGQHLWLSSIENCIFAKNKNATFNAHCKSAVWRFPNGRNKIHPTEKNLKLFEMLVETSSNPDMIVCDPCLGSGTTALACKNLNRRFIGIEKDRNFFDLANKRLDI